MSEKPVHSTALAFDFGTKRIGAAYGSSLTGSAQELKPIQAKDGIPSWDEIQAMLEEWQPDTAIVGLPLNMDGSENEMVRRARKFGNRMHGRYRIAVAFVDERLSTQEAKEQAHARGIHGDYVDNSVDSIAARLLLESWWRETNI